MIGNVIGTCIKIIHYIKNMAQDNRNMAQDIRIYMRGLIQACREHAYLRMIQDYCEHAYLWMIPEKNLMRIGGSRLLRGKILIEILI